MTAPALPTEFRGFPRRGGRPGIRNHLTILSVCGLNAPGARKLKAALPGAVLVSSMYGRGQLGADRTFHKGMLEGFGCHPNSGAAIVLAPDRGLRERFQSAVEASGRPCTGFSLQEAEEDGEALLAAATGAGRELLQELAGEPRSPCPVSGLALALECGHSDASSGIVANPLAGDLTDLLVAAGGTAVFSETLEWTGTEQSLYARCRTPATKARLERLVAERHEIARAAGQDVRLGNPGPQNHDGGITTLEEKSHGAVAKGGTGPIVGALRQGEGLPPEPGLFLMDTPTLSPESISSMVAAGAQLVLFTTGHGNPYGSAMAPTIKLTANPRTAARLPRQIDFDASAVFSGTLTRSDALPELAELGVAVCEGRQVAAEILDEGDEAISRLLPSV